jgi:hypothetical protein
MLEHPSSCLYNVEVVKYTSACHVPLSLLQNIFRVERRCFAEGTVRDVFAYKILPYLDVFTAIIATK